MKNKNIVSVILLFLPLVLGFTISSIIDSKIDYTSLVKPFLAPPGWIFTSVWIVLYLLLGISSILIYRSIDKDINEALCLYFLQLFFNLCWPVIFFYLKLRLVAAVWIVLLIFITIKMLNKFYHINKLASYILIPYLLWLLFAAYLNIFITFLN